MHNVTLTDFYMNNGRSEPFSISQCTSYSGATNISCDTSTFKISNITLSNITGSVDSAIVANMQCSADANGCDNIMIENIHVTDTGSVANATHQDAYRYLCNNVNNPIGFECTGNVTSNSGGS